MPRLAERLRSGWLHLHPTRVELPSGTLAFHLALLHGRSDLAPGTRWWDRRAGVRVDGTRPASLRRVQEGVAAGAPGLLRDGSAYGSSISGGASSTDLSLAALARPRGRLGRTLRRAGAGAWASALLPGVRQGLAEAARLLPAPGRARIQQARLAPVGHAVAGVLARRILVELAVRDLQAGVPAVLCNFFGHDQLAHHFGPDSLEASLYLRHADQDIERLLSTAERSVRRALRCCSPITARSRRVRSPARTVSSSRI